MVEERLKRLDASLGQQAPKMVDPRHILVHEFFTRRHREHGDTSDRASVFSVPLCEGFMRREFPNVPRWIRESEGRR